MARKDKDPERGNPRAQSKEERKQARAKGGGSGAAAATKASRPKAGRAGATRAKAGKAGSAGDDAGIETRLERLEQAVASQAERSDELLKKVEAVLAGSNQSGGPKSNQPARQSGSASGAAPRRGQS